ncbi:hypothetical protein CABS01_04062 [Colletotrichum abscissum]|uniref:Uncharacterized protein n=1 Tax=Colletotrichum abscissum TaxID=1671311 RepID=A0A9Q0AYS2_9PEZI|nr:uncharacterized protein CABS01_04062 [Colletotrichum abscissum]KAI3532245.1 hypothetical protein CABS02_13911 [Colletotrichum abscissum]KAK1473400.1 hypothetical protein CABS01_04062 [Colletotrichum abscissum]
MGKGFHHAATLRNRASPHPGRQGRFVASLLSGRDSRPGSSQQTYEIQTKDPAMMRITIANSGTVRNLVNPAEWHTSMVLVNW